jgi:hypothetical protein
MTTLDTRAILCEQSGERCTRTRMQQCTTNPPFYPAVTAPPLLPACNAPTLRSVGACCIAWHSGDVASTAGCKRGRIKSVARVTFPTWSLILPSNHPAATAVVGTALTVLVHDADDVCTANSVFADPYAQMMVWNGLGVWDVKGDSHWCRLY